MAFFGLTLFGYQNTIQAHLRGEPQIRKFENLAVIPTDQTSRYTGHNNSFNELRRLQILNTRSPQEFR
ncbi:hypothetical protein EG68_08003 [Paragonimus skrjabini miyazakii]|uniref:Uncharacterized protein n=1 Tax=Paragonimus skrjabini miyazakii TaxID=59628 RepID=A0A8S9YQP2_9TREM|nr:hypothetical protein EG68_08003 [Paragonimus skrjabini miyazakii]